MPNPITIDLSAVQAKFSLAAKEIDKLTETCVQSVATAIYANWQSLAKKKLHSTLPDYLQHLIVVDKGRFAKQIILTGELPNMLELGASAFDMKEGFKKSKYVKHTVAVYNAKGKMVYPGGDWYLTVPFRQGTPGIVGQAGFANEMPQEIYDIMVHRAANNPLRQSEIPEPYDVPRSRAAIMDDKGNTLFAEYEHKSSIFAGLTKKTAAYNKVTQNTYVSFRRAGERSDPMSWIHRGFEAMNLADEAIQMTDVDTIVENEVAEYLDKTL
jgi:hypothetical protein